MNIDFTTLSCSFGIPKWWLEVNFDTNFDTSIQTYMKDLGKKWVEQSTNVRKLGWYVPDYNQIKNTMFKSGFETRPCYDCKTETTFCDVAFAKCFPYTQMPTVQMGQMGQMGDQQIKHFNLFILCGICASKERPISMTNNPEKAVEVQCSKSKKQLLLEAELFEEQQKHVKVKEELRRLREHGENMLAQIESEKRLQEPLEEELELVKKENDEKREQLEKFAQEKNKLLSGFQGCADIGQTILDALGQFSKEIKENTRKLENTTDHYENTFSNEKKCGVCWGKIDIYTALKPCHHVYCQRCAAKAVRCPLCNEGVQTRKVIHFP